MLELITPKACPFIKVRTKKSTYRKNGKCFQKKAAAYSPTWCSSTIGADGLNFPVRNGKGWAPSPWPPKIVYTLINVRYLQRMPRKLGT